MLQVDPDAILFPERLRGHVGSHIGQPGPKNAVLNIENAAFHPGICFIFEMLSMLRNVFFLNCAVHVPAMYGAVEALYS